MSTPTRPFTSRRCAGAAVPALLVCVLVLLPGCVSLPEGKTPGLGTAQVESTRVAAQTAAPSATPRATSTPGAEPSVPLAPSSKTPGAPTPSAIGTTAVSPLKHSVSCKPSDSPDVFAMAAPEAGSVERTPICITGFEPYTEAELWITDPDAELEYYSQAMNGDGTAVVQWSAAAGLLEGSYTFEATQGDLRAIGSVEVESGPEPQEPAPEPQEGGPSIEVYPVGDSGWSFEVALSGFEPYQEVPLTLQVATDETATEFEDVDVLFEQVDEQGETTFPLEITPGEYPSSMFALSYFLEDGTLVFAPFQVE